MLFLFVIDRLHIAVPWTGGNSSLQSLNFDHPMRSHYGPRKSSGQHRTQKTKQVEEATHFTYLGSVISSDGDAEQDVACCIGKESAALQQLRPIRKSPSFSPQSKLRP
ncbi:hypothetical protein ABG768_007003 [Culter alburnus]|uniref:Uncharacterized protein n=1 Tax=Culter alburnus TaxID=194366 RepID=A0AAW1ZQP4_CULAL